MWSTVPAAVSLSSQAQILLLLLLQKTLPNRATIQQENDNFASCLKNHLKSIWTMAEKKGMRREVRRSSESWERKQLELPLLFLLLLLLTMYLNIKFCCTHNFLPYLGFVICVCGFYCGALRFASVGGSGNCWCDREMCVHVYVFSLLHVACGMSIRDVAAAAAMLWFLLQEVTWQSSSACLERPPLCLCPCTLYQGVYPHENP